MDCDGVFKILTSGPFPTGTDVDADVESHLVVCFSCHCLAEALRPAANLTNEAIDPEESRTLPGYWVEPERGSRGSVTTQRRLVPHVHVQARPLSVVDTRAKTQSPVMRFFVGVLLGAAVALMLYTFGMPVR